eukprot:Em0016g799a
MLAINVATKRSFDEYEEKASRIVDETQCSDELNRVRKRKRHDDDSGAEEVVLVGKDKFRIETYLPILDSLSTELNRRVQAYELLFGFLVEFLSKADDELRLATETFRENYPDDVDIDFQEEMVHFKLFAAQLEDRGDTIPASQSYELISENMMLAINVATSVAEMPTDVDVSTCLTALANAATRCPQVSVDLDIPAGSYLDFEPLEVLCLVTSARSKVPLTYSYLSEGSILATLLSVLRDLTASPLVQSTVPLVRAALGVLGASMASLPPVDFSDILLPICEYSTSLGGSRGICDVCEPPLPKCKCTIVTMAITILLPKPISTPQCPHLHPQCPHLHPQCPHVHPTMSPSPPTMSPSPPHNVPISTPQCPHLHPTMSPSPPTMSPSPPTMSPCPPHNVPISTHNVPIFTTMSPSPPIMSPSPPHNVPISTPQCPHLHPTMSPSPPHNVPISTHDVPISTHNVPISTHNVPISTPQYTNKLMPSLSWLLTTVHHCCSPQHVKNPLLNQTDLLHTLLCWTRAHQPSVEQMRLVFSLTSCIVMADVTSSPDLSSLLVAGGCVEHLLCELWNDPHISFAPQARLLKEKDNRAAKRQRYQEDLEENRAAKGSDIKRTSRRTVLLKGSDIKRTSRRTVLLKGSDIKRTSRRTVLLKGSDIKRTSRRTVLLKGSDIKRTSRRTVLLKGSDIKRTSRRTAQRYQEDLEENRAAKRQRYQEDLEENRAAKRQRYQEDLEENRAAKRQRYQEDLEEDRVLLKGSDIKRTSRRTACC